MNTEETDEQQITLCDQFQSQANEKWEVMANAVLKNDIKDEQMQLAGVDCVGKETMLDGISKRSSSGSVPSRSSEKKKKKIKAKFVRLLDEMHMQKEHDKRIKQAFTFGLKLNKDRLPDRLKLFESLNKIVKNHE